MMDNLSMGLSTEAIQEGCAALAKRLFGITASSTAMERYNIERMGINEYTYLGTCMDKHEYELFLRKNCPQAYSQYRQGQRLIGAGWGTIGGGVLAMIAGGVMIGLYEPDPNSKNSAPEGLALGGIAACVVGGAAIATGIPLVCVGYIKRNNAYKVYNNTCASSSATQLSFNLTAGQNGLGIAMQF